jgi:hypothetical protein
MQEDLYNAFNKLSLDEQSKFIITNILNNNNFTKMHNFIKNNYYNYYMEGEELIKHELKIKNDKLTKSIYNELERYERAVDKCMVDQSRYKDIVYYVYDAQQDIEEYCKSQYINGDNTLLETIVDCCNDTQGTIYSYGGETSGDQDQTLKNAIRILLKNPYLDEKIKNSEEYKEYYEEFINEDKTEGSDEVEYGKNDIKIEESYIEELENNTKGYNEKSDNETDSSDDNQSSDNNEEP